MYVYIYIYIYIAFDEIVPPVVHAGISKARPAISFFHPQINRGGVQPYSANLSSSIVRRTSRL